MSVVLRAARVGMNVVLVRTIKFALKTVLVPKSFVSLVPDVGGAAVAKLSVDLQNVIGVPCVVLRAAAPLFVDFEGVNVDIVGRAIWRRRWGRRNVNMHLVLQSSSELLVSSLLCEPPSLLFEPALLVHSAQVLDSASLFL